MSTLLECTNELLNQITDGQYSGGTITWDTVVLLEKDNVGILGDWKYDIGAKVRMPDGSDVEVTETVAEYFNHAVSLNVPIDIAVSNDKEEVLAFLRKIYKDDKEDEESMLAGLEDDDSNESEMLTTTENKRVLH